MLDMEEFYLRCLADAIERREEARQAGDYQSFRLAELDVQNYQTMLNNAKAHCATATQ